jgi:hypothetical protein
VAYRNARFKRTPTEAVERGEGGRPLLVYGPAKRLLQPTTAVLGAPGVHPDPIDPQAPVGGLIEAFDEVLNLRQHLLIPRGLGRLVDVHHRGPLEVRHRAGYCVPYVEGGEPSSRGRDNGSLARLFWRLLDDLDYWLTQVRLWLADAVCGPGAAGSG